MFVSVTALVCCQVGCADARNLVHRDLATGCAAVPPPRGRAAGARSPRCAGGPRAGVRPRAHAILYPLDEAFHDALYSGLQECKGTGPWHRERSRPRVRVIRPGHARILVVNVYCTPKEAQAFRLDVYSPTRGWVRIYAEAKVPISTVRRRASFSFNAEAQPPPRPEAAGPPLALAVCVRGAATVRSLAVERILPTCYGGVEIHRPQGGCLGDLAPPRAVGGKEQSVPRTTARRLVPHRPGAACAR